MSNIPCHGDYIYIQSLKYSIILFNVLVLLFNILKIFKVAEDLDLGCGVGGGKDSKDIFKVGTATRSLSISGLGQVFENAAASFY